MCLFRRNKKRNIHSILTPNDSKGVEPFLYSFLFFSLFTQSRPGTCHPSRKKKGYLGSGGLKAGSKHEFFPLDLRGLGFGVGGFFARCGRVGALGRTSPTYN